MNVSAILITIHTSIILRVFSPQKANLDTLNVILVWSIESRAESYWQHRNVVLINVFLFYTKQNSYC